MTNHYKVLGVKQNASISEIKRAFREKAKQLHPDITGKVNSKEMRHLLDAYEVLSKSERRFTYDRLFNARNAFKKSDFNYLAFLKEHSSDPEYRAKLIFFELLHFEEDDAVSVWQEGGGLNFPLEKFLDREDLMDCGFILAEELEKRGFFYEAFLIVTKILGEERQKPYFRHFTVDVELFLKELVRIKLRRAVNDDVWISCMHILLNLDFPPKDEARWLKSLGETFYKKGDKEKAFEAFQAAKERDPKISIPKNIKFKQTD